MCNSPVLLFWSTSSNPPPKRIFVSSCRVLKWFGVSPKCKELVHFSRSSWSKGIRWLSPALARLGCVSRPRTESKSRFNNLSVFEFMLKLGIDGNLTPLARSSQKQAGHLIKLSTLLRDSSNGPGCSGLNWPRCRVNDPSFLKIFFRANCFCRIHFIRPNICNVLPGNL